MSESSAAAGVFCLYLSNGWGGALAITALHERFSDRSTILRAAIHPLMPAPDPQKRAVMGCIAAPVTS